MALDTFLKQPDEVLDYDFDFDQWMPDGDSLSDTDLTTSVVTVPAGLNLVSKLHPGQNRVKLWLSGGTDGEQYEIHCEITTAEGRVKESQFIIQVKQL